MHEQTEDILLTMTTKKKPRTTITTPTIIDQSSVIHSGKVFGSQPLGERPNIKIPKRKKRGA